MKIGTVVSYSNRMDEEKNSELQQIVREKISQEAFTYFGMVGDNWVDYAVNYFLDEDIQAGRIIDLIEYGFIPHQSRILDVAAGCGQFLFKALEEGYDCYGIEPEAWKQQYIQKKLKYQGMAESHAHRVKDAVGEHIPFPDNFFDCATSLNTLEHVQNPRQVIVEMLRVVKVGGGVHIRCPDYRSTVESHYRLPWLPLLPRKVASLYLRILNRPIAGLQSIQYVTKPRIKKWLTQIEREQKVRLLVIDGERVAFENELRRRNFPLLPGAFFTWKLLRYFRDLFRQKMSVNLFVRIVAK